MPIPMADARDRLRDAMVADHGAEIYRIAFALTGSEADAMDLTQETLVVAVESAPAIEDPRRWRHWLLGVLHHKRVDWIRARRRKVRPDRLAPRDAQDPVETLEAADEHARVRRALLELPDDDRELLILAYYEDLAIDGMSHILGVPAGTVKSRLHAARAALRARLERKET